MTLEISISIQLLTSMRSALEIGSSRYGDLDLSELSDKSVLPHESCPRSMPDFDKDANELAADAYGNRLWYASPGEFPWD